MCRLPGGDDFIKNLQAGNSTGITGEIYTQRCGTSRELCSSIYMGGQA